MVILALYAYVLPYKYMLANIFELLFQLSLALLLLLRSTQNIVDTYLVFPHGNSSSGACSHKTNAATLTWLLFPFAYFPLAFTFIVIIVKIIQKLW